VKPKASKTNVLREIVLGISLPPGEK
jgi:hypothetical protein